MRSLNGFILPEDFLIGTANSAFQSEGAWQREGKSESIMEHYAKEFAGKVPPYLSELDKDVAKRQARQVYSTDLPDRGCFFYDNYEAYIEDMKKTGQNVYRMSLAWPRIIPTGTGAVNISAIEYYDRVINKLISCGITPFVDIYHWDLPQCLMDEGGFSNPRFPEWFENYVRILDGMTVRKTDDDIPDGWITEYSCAFRHLANAYCGMGNYKKGYEYLERTLALAERWAKIPDETPMSLGNPLVFGETKVLKKKYGIELPNGKKFPLIKGIRVYLGDLVYCMTTDHAEWSWFDPIRNEPRYQQILARAKELTI